MDPYSRPWRFSNRCRGGIHYYQTLHLLCFMLWPEGINRITHGSLDDGQLRDTRGLHCPVSRCDHCEWNSTKWDIIFTILGPNTRRRKVNWSCVHDQNGRWSRISHSLAPRKCTLTAVVRVEDPSRQELRWLNDDQSLWFSRSSWNGVGVRLD